MQARFGPPHSYRAMKWKRISYALRIHLKRELRKEMDYPLRKWLATVLKRILMVKG